MKKIKRYSFKLADYSAATEAERKHMLDALVAAANDSKQIELGRQELEKQIQNYEAKYGISSEQMLKELEAGTRKEILEIRNWCIALHTPGKRY